MKLESWHYHHLARRAKTYGIEKELIRALEKAASSEKSASDSHDFPPLVIKAFKRLANIRSFGEFCEDAGCLICNFIAENYRSPEFSSEKSWFLNVELYRWQKETKRLWWENSGRGIVKVVTGAGKTILALSLISDLRQLSVYKKGGLKVIIIVPTTALLDQWLVSLMQHLNLSRKHIGVFYGKEKDKLDDKDVLIYVVNSAREHLPAHIDAFKGEDVFLIADECHRYGSKENSKIFNRRYAYTLGLSATPERHSDFGFEKILVPNLGPIIFSYPYLDALRDGIIPPYKIIRLRVNLLEVEKIKYENLSRKISGILEKLLSTYPELDVVDEKRFFQKIGKLKALTNDPLIDAFTVAVNKRKEVLHRAANKLLALEWLMKSENLSSEKVLVFHERIVSANWIYQFLKENGFAVWIYHSDRKINERISSLDSFRSAKRGVLVTCKALDEGLDVPETTAGVIVAGTSSVRQWIQRMGRILRRAPGKEYSKIYVIFVAEAEKDVFKEKDLREFEKTALRIEQIDLNFKAKE
jgi:superfamily II DNA or RNA helicase